MKIQKWIGSTSRRRGIALILVTGALALMTVLLLAMFSVTETEYKSTQGFVASQTAKQLGDVATAIVQAQIQNGQNEKTGVERTTHATQPGAVRVYNRTGFLAAYKLYSSSKMSETATGVAGETKLVNESSPPADWNSPANLGRYVDLNEPVVRAPLTTAPGAQPAIYFPIIDPRAAYNFLGAQAADGVEPPYGTATTKVEGFTYTNKTIGTASATLSGVVTPATALSNPSLLRLPMPVEWMYVLKDGSFGTLDSANTFVSASGVVPSEKNPIVGRIAFWTDDESCKININTASEPTYMGTPFYYHERDRKWAHFPAATSEFQRYPGHPATVALSSVLLPYFRLDPQKPDPGLSAADVVSIKDKFYDMSPKIIGGDTANGKIVGSESGTVPFALDDFSKGYRKESSSVSAINISSTRNERLFASVDEMLFKDLLFDNGLGRAASKVQATGSSTRTLFDHDVLERSRFFLSAHGRAPEFTIHGLPRVCMWPVADETPSAGKPAPELLRTNFDNIIALCSTLRRPSGSTNYAANSYIFRRMQAHSATHDVTGAATGYTTSDGLKRNSLLLEFITAQLSALEYPRTSRNGTSSNYLQKYGIDNVRQIAVEIFDYIRSTNLYDSILARDNDGTGGAGNIYDKADALEKICRTYTNQRIAAKATGDGQLTSTTAGSSAADRSLLAGSESMHPGHGTVTPAVWSQGGKSYRGFGRFFTLSEVGFQFICTADGKNEIQIPLDPDPTKFNNYAVDLNGVKSGGGSASRIDPAEQNGSPRKNKQEYGGKKGIDGEKEARWYSNFPPLTKFGPADLKYGTSLAKAATDPTATAHPSFHPGYDPFNWNFTLEVDKPLADILRKPDGTPILDAAGKEQGGEKRIQGIFRLETFCPSLGWTALFPEWTIVLDGDYIAGIKLNDKTMWDTVGPVPVKSNGNVYGGHPLGGHVGPTTISGTRGGRPVSGEGIVAMRSDPNWVSDNTTGHNALTNYGLTSNFITIARDKPMRITFPDKEFVVKIYDKHDWENRQPVQIIRIKFPNDPGLPVPKLVGAVDGGPGKGGGANYDTRLDPNTGNWTYTRAELGPKFWCYNFQGAIGQMTGTVNPLACTAAPKEPFWAVPPDFHKPGTDSPDRQALRGRFDNSPGAHPSVPLPKNLDGTPASANGIAQTPDGVSDTERTMVPAVADYRIIAAMYDVPTTMWKRNPMWDNPLTSGKPAPYNMLHSYSSFFNGETGSTMAGEPYYDSGGAMSAGSGRAPDVPPDMSWVKAAKSLGDFDVGIMRAREGPYINKPDEGNYYAGIDIRHQVTRFLRSAYFNLDDLSSRNTADWRSGVFMTPNRMVSSPVMFGSLPTGVWPGGIVTGKSTALGNAGLPADYAGGSSPWQTLLFRPHAQSASDGVPNTAAISHPGNFNPRDHFLLDLFFMPVVEPYAISEPLSQAGKINLNYQILPFTHIRRATGLHAVLKGEFMTAIPNPDVETAKNYAARVASKTEAEKDAPWDTFWEENPANPANRKFWHRPIDVNETLTQFDLRFANGGDNLERGLFRAASQICEVHLVPDMSGGLGAGEVGLSGTTVLAKMTNFWRSHSPTGDNIRERPYSNIYSRVTTRSNTFRVHVRAQVVKKARSTAPDKFNPDKDSVLSEYRGSTVLERYIDPNDTANPLPDYAASATPLNEKPLDTFYKFRSLETKRFNP